MRFLFILLFSISIVPANAQHEILSEFSGFQHEKTIQIRCVVKQGYQCLGINIYKSADGIDFKQIGRIPGICGDPNIDLQYTFIDSQPYINSTNYYQVEPSNYDRSDYIEVEFYNIYQENYLIINDKQQNQIKIVLENPAREALFLEAYSLKGQALLNLTTNERFFVIQKRLLNHKVIIFIVRNTKGILISGKLINL